MAEITPEEKQKINDYLSHPLDFPPDFKDWMADYFATNIPKIPLSQVFGFQLWRVHSASPIDTGQSTSSTSYTDLGTVGPTLSNLSKGYYIVMFGADVSFFSPGNTRTIGLSIDGAAPVAGNEAPGNVGSIGLVCLVNLATDALHELKLKYKVSGGTFTFSKRWLHALRVTTE